MCCATFICLHSHYTFLRSHPPRYIIVQFCFLLRAIVPVPTPRSVAGVLRDLRPSESASPFRDDSGVLVLRFPVLPFDTSLPGRPPTRGEPARRPPCPPGVVATPGGGPPAGRSNFFAAAPSWGWCSFPGSLRERTECAPESSNRPSEYWGASTVTDGRFWPAVVGVEVRLSGDLAGAVVHAAHTGGEVAVVYYVTELGASVV